MNQKKQLTIFFLIAYALPYVLGILMWYGSQRQMDLSMFANAQMMYPAAGVMLAFLCTKWDDQRMPKKFFFSFLILAGLMAVMSVVSIFTQQLPWALIGQLPLVLGSILGWIFLLTEKKEKREAYGLRGKHAEGSIFCVILFVALYILRYVVACLVSSELSDISSLVSNPMTWLSVVSMPINFFLVFIAFFGEEYGWRYYLTPVLQDRFGKRWGVLLLGVLWGLWHLPIDFFYYTVDTGLQMAVAQQVTCITLGIFFSYAYMKTENIWVPVILHMLNNNLVPVFRQDYTPDVLENQSVQWGSILPSLLLNGVIFGSFILAKEYGKRKVVALKAEE